MVVLAGSLKFSSTFFTKPSSSPSENSTCNTLLSSNFKFGEPKSLQLFCPLMSSICTLGSSRSLRKASMAEISLTLAKYSSVSGITTSQMNVTPATKNGYLLKKSSMETTIASKFILLETWLSVGRIVSEAKQERGKDKPK